MHKLFTGLLLFCCVLLLAGCKTKTATVVKVLNVDPEKILKVDLDQDLSKVSMQDLRLLKNSLYARQGYCLMEADLRGYFTANMPAYDSIMNARFWWDDGVRGKSPDGAPLDTMTPISFTPKEQTFMKRIDSFIAEKKKLNFIETNGRTLANVDNMVNLFQLETYTPEFLDALKRNNFVIIPGKHAQLFHVYEENDYRQLPNFITTDLYLQVFHMYFAYVLKSLEMQKLQPDVMQLTAKMNEAAMNVANASTDPVTKAEAEFTAAFFGVAYEELTGDRKAVPALLKGSYEAEIANIKALEVKASPLLQYKYGFPYDQFKPRGHYSRNDTLQRYFKSMMWLQLGVMCREKSEQLNNSIFMAYLLNSSPEMMKLYKSVFEPIVFLIGEPDNISVMDVSDIMRANNFTQPTQLNQKITIDKINGELVALAKHKNRIAPKIEEACHDRINFMPQRYLPDNEVLDTMVDVTKNAERAYPEGLDVFAAFGCRNAEDILTKEEGNDKKWNKYQPTLCNMKKKFEHFDGWNVSVYNKWLESLVAMQKTEKQYPGFMQTPEWDKKNLNTALASWAELKHDGLLYAEQPNAAECVGAGPPDPTTVGFVEPNISFWLKMLELLNLTDNMLKKNGFLTPDLDSKTKTIKDAITFMLTVSNKELKKQKLSEQEYKTIEIAGSDVERLSLSLIDPNQYIQFWYEVKGADTSVAAIADIYTRNIQDCPKNGVLEVGTGNVNDIYVVVEIEGYLYITKGATFSYHEFVQPPANRLTDEEWQKILRDGNAPGIPKWMDGIMQKDKAAPKVNEKISYSSGC